MKKLNICTFLSALQLSTFAFAGTMGASNESILPGAAVFAGLGGSYNSVGITQDLNPLIGITNVYNAGTLIAVGSAGGPAIPFNQTETTFAPEVQAGYFRFFSEHPDHLFGFKFQYQYLGLTFTNNQIVAPQKGTFTTTGAAPTDSTFTGRATIASSQIKVQDELGLMAFLGTSFNQGYVYLGAGPSVFKIQNNLDNVIGYADFNGIPSNVTGTPTNFSSSSWVWGGIAQLGMTYVFKPTWFLDINYTYAITDKNSTSYVKSFTNTSATTGYINQGTLNGVASNRVIAQALIVSVNKLFPV
ncbi:MAG: hypothetical protein K0U24_03640 [Gammaproteobacteria bacterium]|nr:hypothetical protein [Gammaproteobacteria bacterium]MCH9763308.1 hypothetical protein [Gammaproteobacteria bacterium]